MKAPDGNLEPEPPPPPEVLGATQVHEGFVVSFTMNRSQTFREYKAVYADVLGVPMNTIRFYVNGVELSDDATPDQVGLVNDHFIQVYLQQSSTPTPAGGEEEE